MFPFLLLCSRQEHSLYFGYFGSGDVGFVIEVCSIHILRDLVISCNLFCISSHCVGMRCYFWNNCLRFSIARFYLSRKVVCRFWRLLGDIGYMSHGLFVRVVAILRTMVFGTSCNWTR